MKKLILIFFVLGLFAGGALVLRWLSDRRFPNFREDIELYVYPGQGPQEILAALPDTLVLRKGSLRRVFRRELEGREILPGHYVIEASKPSVYVPRMLRSGWQTPVSLTLAGSLRLKGKLAKKIASQLLLDSASVHKALNDSALLASYGFSPQDVFSMIIPDSYELYWTASPRELLGKLKEGYDAFWTPERLQKAELQGYTPKEVSVIASIVRSESNWEPEYPSIAGVYLNRLRIGMKLQADPTVAFIHDYSLSRIYNRHLEVQSPYNTYLHAGLPPGPICVPSKAAIDAVLEPDRQPYLYFCASPELNGRHLFAKTYAEHLLNARRYQRALDLRAAMKAGGS